MAGALRKTMVYLGLSEEDQRQDRERYDGRGVLRRGGPLRRRVRPLGPRRTSDSAEHPAAVTHSRRPAPWRAWSASAEVGSLNRITTIHPRTYNEAKTIGE